MSLRRLLRPLRRGAQRALGRSAPAPHAHHHPTFTEEELLARTEEFNQSAEKHWQTIQKDPAGRGHVLNKPLSTVQDTGPILYRLGLVITELQLGIGHTVLDFAAGSCWLSSYLNRLRCRTVSVDVSPTALTLGQELFGLDPRQRRDLSPQFLPYDGHRLPLPDESVDRVVCFDAFHHVPNQQEVLREMARVLKPGGRAVFAEPGEDHAHTDQSVFEMETHGVLENDLHLDDVVEKAMAAGFSEALVKPYAEPSALTFSAAEYLRFMDGDDDVLRVEQVRESLRHFVVFVLKKGEGRPDSRSPGRLQAAITVPPGTVLRGLAGASAVLDVTVQNTGDTLWLHQVDDLGGYVMLGGHLEDEGGHIRQRSWARGTLPRDVAPGETVTVPLTVAMPRSAGAYRLRLDLVVEWLAWFEQQGSPTPHLPLIVQASDSALPHQLQAQLTLVGPPPPPVAPGADIPLLLRLTNTGDTRWLAGDAGAGAVALGARVKRDGRELTRDAFRVPLPLAVDPGDSLPLEAVVAAPPVAGRYTLELDLVAEGVCWFEHHGSPALPVEVTVTDETPDSRRPGLLAATLTVDDAPTHRLPGGTPLTLHVRVSNDGNTRWLSRTDDGRGQVGLGVQLLDGEGTVLERDVLRCPLASDVEPGQDAAFSCTVALPFAPGRYLLRLDMVAEQVAWFGARGSSPTDVAVVVA